MSGLTNNEIKNLKKLKDKKYRKENNLFLVEGKKSCVELLNSSYEIEMTITSNSQDYLDFPNLKIVDYEIIKSISTTETPQDIVCVGKIKHSISTVPLGNSLVLDELQDPGNIGTLIRSALAFNFKDVYFINCVDIYNEKVIRSSMGMIFKINPHFVSEEWVIENKKYFDCLLGTNMNGTSLDKICLPKGKIAVIIGNEGNGVSKSLLKNCDDIARIDMQPDVESLNAGVAGSILMYGIYKGE